MGILANSRKKATTIQAVEKMMKKRTGAAVTRKEYAGAMKSAKPKPMMKRAMQAIGRGAKAAMGGGGMGLAGKMVKKMKRGSKGY